MHFSLQGARHILRAKFTYRIYSPISQSAYESNASLDVKKRPKFDTSVNKSTLGRDLCLWAAGGDICTEHVARQSIWRLTCDAETPPRPPAMTWWRPVGGWSAGKGGERMSPVKSIAPCQLALAHPPQTRCCHHHRPALPAFGQHFVTAISRRLTQAAPGKMLTK